MLQNVLISKIKDFKLLNCHTLSIHENNFSTYDIVSDFQAGFEYLEGQTFEEIVTDLNDSRVANETSLKFAKAPTRTCSMISESGGSFTTRFWVSGFHFMWIWIQEVRFLRC